MSRPKVISAASSTRADAANCLSRVPARESTVRAREGDGGVSHGGDLSESWPQKAQKAQKESSELRHRLGGGKGHEKHEKHKKEGRLGLTTKGH